MFRVIAWLWYFSYVSTLWLSFTISMLKYWPQGSWLPSSFVKTSHNSYLSFLPNKVLSCLVVLHFCHCVSGIYVCNIRSFLIGPLQLQLDISLAVLQHLQLIIQSFYYLCFPSRQREREKWFKLCKPSIRHITHVRILACYLLFKIYLCRVNIQKITYIA